MRTLGSERRERIVSQLADEGRIVASQLASELGVALVTVRRDLDELAAAGALRRVHGGALPVSPSPRRFTERRGLEARAKAAIATAAVPLIAPGQVLVLGGGTTVLELARRLPRDLRATAITSAPDVAVALLDHPRLEVVVLGGPVNPDTRTVVGADAVAALRTVRADLCLLGACSVHAQAGVTVLHRDEAVVERVMAEQAARIAVLADATKLGSAGPFVVGPAEAVDVLVTDGAAPDDQLALLAERGMEVIRA